MNAPALPDLVHEQSFRRLELTVTRRLDGLLQGDHLGLVPGLGTEPADAREYQPGDDVRRIDWNLTARTSVPHVRDLVADRELTTWVLVDATASMDFGTGRIEKRDLAVAAVAAVGFLTDRIGNRLGVQILSAAGLRRIPPEGGRTHLLAVLRRLRTAPRTPPGAPATTSLSEAIALLRRTAHRRGLVVVVSDLLDGVDPNGPEPPWGRQLRLLRHRHQVLAIEVVDPRELALPDVGLLTVVDPETGRRGDIPTASRRLRARYEEAATAQREAVARILRRAGVAHLRLRTDGDWVRDIARHVLTARRLAGAAPARQGRTPS